MYLNEHFMMFYQNDLLDIGFPVNRFSFYMKKIISKGYCFVFLAIPHRGSAYRCLQTKHWKDPVLKSIAERSSIPLHRYLPAMFTMWIGKVLVLLFD